MKIKTYKGDLSKLRSCIKVYTGSMTELNKLIRMLVKWEVPFDIDSELNIHIQFFDALKYNLKKLEGYKVVEHIEPLGLDIKLSYYDCSTYYNGKFFVSKHYRSTTYSRFVYNEKDDLLVVLLFDKSCSIEEALKDPKSGIKCLMPVLFRRGLISEKLYKKAPGNEMKYYEA